MVVTLNFNPQSTFKMFNPLKNDFWQSAELQKQFKREKTRMTP
jgi:hypothetical protein